MDDRPAFPVPEANNANGSLRASPYKGMSLRDYFAAAALTGLIAGAEKSSSNDALAGMAYSIADAMLKESAKE